MTYIVSSGALNTTHSREREADERKAERERRFEREFELSKMEHKQAKILNEMKMIEMKAMR